MEVRPPERFVHPGQLDVDACLVDPREERFPEDVDTVHLNLEGCTVLEPPAWLWCVTYVLMAREQSIPVKVRAPENERVRAELGSVGLFGLLRSANVSLDPGDIGQPDSENVVIPMVRFKNQGTVHRLANRAYDELADRGIGRPEVQRIVSEAFVELALTPSSTLNPPSAPSGSSSSFRHPEESESRSASPMAGSGSSVRSQRTQRSRILSLTTGWRCESR